MPEPRNQPNPRPPRERLRLEWLFLLAGPLLLGWLSRKPPASEPEWSRFMDDVDIHNRSGFTELAMLAICLIGVIALARAGRSR